MAGQKSIRSFNGLMGCEDANQSSAGSNGTWLGQPEDGFRNPPLTLRENHNVAAGWSQNHGDKKVGVTPWEFNTNKPEHSMHSYLTEQS